MRSKRAPLSPAVEDYLKAIYQIRAADNVVTTTALAASLGVSAASATNMIKRLAHMKLATHVLYRGVEMTPAGEKIALEVLRHHRLIELFLNETLGIPWDEVHVEAHRLEHVLSDNLEDHISAFLGNPTEDPHGDPIPTKSGQITQGPQRLLADLGPGARVTIRRVDDDYPEHLRHFSSLGLVPHASIEVVGREPFAGPLRLKLTSGEERTLSEVLAREIWVETAPTAKRRNRSEKRK
ncbi:MAG: metal-dependent transcriptional regulator [Chloroflexi bacterium]|nr:metal-dependent transcriptional regulator [Chloroflexota bacterium]